MFAFGSFQSRIQCRTTGILSPDWSDPGPESGAQSPDLDVDPPFLLSIPTGDLCCACDRTLTEPCLGEPHVTSAGPAVSEAYVFIVGYLGAQPITVYELLRGRLHRPHGAPGISTATVDGSPFGMEGGNDAGPRQGRQGFQTWRTLNVSSERLGDSAGLSLLCSPNEFFGNMSAPVSTAPVMLWIRSPSQ